MAAIGVPHFANDAGVTIIHIGVKEFKCMGARAPFDHPHVFLDMGKDNEIICPYCSTVYRYKDTLKGNQTEPAGCIVES